MAKTSKAASTAMMELLHNELAKLLLEQLRKYRQKAKPKDSDAPQEEIPASLINTIRQFLKDNNIEKAPKTDDDKDPLGLLDREFEFDEGDDLLDGSVLGG